MELFLIILVLWLCCRSVRPAKPKRNRSQERVLRAADAQATQARVNAQWLQDHGHV